MNRRSFALLAPGLLLARKTSPPVWLERTRIFADTLLRAGRDTVGPVRTPAWAGVIDTRNWTVPVAGVPPPPGIRPGDRALGGANLFHDSATLRVFLALSKRTGDARYARAAREYMRWFLSACRSPQNGLLAWGEHLYYDFTRDAVAVERKSHELLEWTPPWDLLWETDPRAVAGAIAGLRYHHFEDTPGSLYNRHAWFDRAEHQPRKGSQPWIKHSGLYAHAFAFLHAKTREKKWLDWAVGEAGIYWDRRHPVTGLTLGCIDDPRPTSKVASVQIALLAYWLRKAGQVLPAEPLFRERAGQFIHAWEKYGYDTKRRAWRSGVELDGTAFGNQTVDVWHFAYGESELLPYGRIAAYFAALDADRVMADTARRVALAARETPVPADASVEGVGLALNLALDLHALDRDPQWLRDAERYATLASERFWRQEGSSGLFVRLAGDPYYEAKTCAGSLAAGLLRLDGELRGRRLEGDWTL
jgi:hypothetical protein